ncbi:hypothetical protein PDE_05033 [Penicillium oxalicum 114-2]|uniref:Uncharacterized protein n=1 Tax=Penicillium oxalicum (strain 114-2 / CGMCC 5302) TaxID=933388 RepID=S8AV41_PENO1|nr:hypothetical protein PDE_05033 [Penicillium oxalicum 114-2]
MQSVTMQFSPVKEGRRILGDRDSNACLSPAHHSKSALTGFSTPVKRTLFTNTSPKKLLPSPIFAGQKRSREQLDQGEGHAPCERRVEGPASTPKNESPRPDVESNTVGLTSQPIRDESQESNVSTTSRSESPKADLETRSIPEDPDARKIFIQQAAPSTFQKAALLRIKLQSAMRNATENQIDRRVSDLEEHSRKVPRISLSTLPSSSPATVFRSTFTPSQLRTPRIGADPRGHPSSTPCQQTPDLPQQPSSVIQKPEHAKQGDRTPPRGLGSPMQLSSPPATVMRYTRTRETADPGNAEEGTACPDPPSPSQRGDAVDGLLKLMSTSD